MAAILVLDDEVDLVLVFPHHELDTPFLRSLESLLLFYCIQAVIVAKFLVPDGDHLAGHNLPHVKSTRLQNRDLTLQLQYRCFHKDGLLLHIFHVHRDQILPKPRLVFQMNFAVVCYFLSILLIPQTSMLFELL